MLNLTVKHNRAGAVTPAETYNVYFMWRDKDESMYVSKDYKF